MQFAISAVKQVRLSAVLFALAMLASTAAVAEGETSCKAYFQVVEQDGGNLRAGMDGAQKKWWENKGHKKYPDLCWDGSVSSNEQAPLSGDLVKIGFEQTWVPSPRNRMDEDDPAARLGDDLQCLRPTAGGN